MSVYIKIGNITMMFQIIQFVCLMLICQLASSQAFDSLTYPYKIHGIVKDSLGNPLPGVNVLSKGDGNQQVSNLDGEFYAYIYNEKTEVIFALPDYSIVSYYPDGRLEVDITLIPMKRSWFYKIILPVRRLFRK